MQRIYRLLGNGRALGQEAINESIASNYTQLVRPFFFFFGQATRHWKHTEETVSCLAGSWCSFDSTVINVAPIYSGAHAHTKVRSAVASSVASRSVQTFRRFPQSPIVPRFSPPLSLLCAHAERRTQVRVRDLVQEVIFGHQTPFIRPQNVAQLRQGQLTHAIRTTPAHLTVLTPDQFELLGYTLSRPFFLTHVWTRATFTWAWLS